MLNNRSKLANTFTLFFAFIGFLLSLYDVFLVDSGISYTGEAWFVAFFMLLAVIFTVMLYSRHHSVPLALQVLSLVIAAIIAVFAGQYWILVCIIVCLIGTITYKAGKVH